MEAVGPLCHHLPQWHHRGLPTPYRRLPCCSGCAHVHWLCAPSMPLSEARVQAAVLTLPWASRNSEDLSEDLHIPYSAGHFLGLNLHALCLSFSKAPWVPSFLPQTWAKVRQGTEILPKDSSLPIFLFPTLTFTLKECFPVCLFSFFFPSHYVFSLLWVPLWPMLLKLQSLSFSFFFF